MLGTRDSQRLVLPREIKAKKVSGTSSMSFVTKKMQNCYFAVADQLIFLIVAPLESFWGEKIHRNKEHQLKDSSNKPVGIQWKFCPL